MNLRAYLMAATALISTSAVAADIRAVPVPAGIIITISGDFNLGDEERFDAVARTAPKALVDFDSRGGHTITGLRIGAVISQRGFSTLVEDDRVCASSCALAWLAGAVRYLAPRGHVGFHGAFVINPDGSKDGTSGGNAIVGDYLGKLGLSPQAIMVLTSSGPNDMYWLTTDNSLGITIKPFPNESQGPNAYADPPSTSPGGQQPPFTTNDDWATEGRWIQLASRPSLIEARSFADYLISLGCPPISIFESTALQGWYVLAIGPVASEYAGNARQSLWDKWLIPSDSRIVTGHHFGTRVAVAAAPATN